MDRADQLIIEIKSLLAKGGSTVMAPRSTADGLTAGMIHEHCRGSSLDIIKEDDFVNRVRFRDKGEQSLRTPSEKANEASFSVENNTGTALARAARIKPETLTTRLILPRPAAVSSSTREPFIYSNKQAGQQCRFMERLDAMNWSLQCLSELQPLQNSRPATACNLKPAASFKVSIEGQSTYREIHGGHNERSNSRPKNLTKLKPPVSSVKDSMNQRDGRLQEKVRPKCQEDQSMAPERPNLAAKPYVKKMQITSDQQDRISQTAVTQRMNQAFLAVLGPGHLPSSMKQNPGSSKLFTESMPAEQSTKDDRLRFRASLARFSRKISFRRGCPKFSRTALRQDEKQTDKPHESDLDTMRTMIQALNLQRMAEYLREEEEARRKEQAVQAEMRKKIDKAVSCPLEPDDFPAETVDVSCNFAPVFEIGLAQIEEGEEEETPREIEIQPSVVTTISHREARLAEMIRDENIRRQREELNRDQMKSLMDKTKDSIRQARLKFLEQEAKRKQKQEEEHRRNQQKYGCCDKSNYHVDLCRHFQCITQGLNETSKQSLRRDRVADLYGGQDEVDELAEVDPTEKEHVMEISPQREGEINDHIIGEDQPEDYTMDYSYRNNQIINDKDTSRMTERDEIEKRMEATLSKMKNVLSDAIDPDEDQNSTWRQSNPRSTRSTQSSKKVINLYSRSKLDSTDHLVNISSYIRESSRSATKQKSKKSVHFAE